MQKHSKLFKVLEYKNRIKDGMPKHFEGVTHYMVNCDWKFDTEMDCVLKIANEHAGELKYFKHDIREVIVNDEDTMVEYCICRNKERVNDFFLDLGWTYKIKSLLVEDDVWEKVWPNAQYMDEKICDYKTEVWVDAYFQ